MGWLRVLEINNLNFGMSHMALFVCVCVWFQNSLALIYVKLTLIDGG